MKLHPQTKLNRFDKLLVLGRGTKHTGELTKTSQERADVADQLAMLMLPKIVMYSGGRSWRQARQGIKPRSEGLGMYQRAISVRGMPPPGIEYLYEEESESTVDNMVNSAPGLDLRNGEALAILSDDLHFMYGRVQETAERAFPDNELMYLQIPRLVSAADIAEEKRYAQITHYAMLGVQPADLDGMRRRQQKIVFGNNILRSVKGVIGRPDELAPEFSYTDVPEFQAFTPQALAGFIIAQAA